MRRRLLKAEDNGGRTLIELDGIANGRKAAEGYLGSIVQCRVGLGDTAATSLFFSRIKK